MLQYLFDNVWVFNAGYDLHPPAALATLLYFNAKDALQQFSYLFLLTHRN